MLWKKLDKALAAKEHITFWWRDDDASDDMENLERLLSIFKNRGLPVVLGVIPASLIREVAELINSYDNCAVYQHGFSHENNSPNPYSMDEFPREHDLDEAMQKIEKGREILEREFKEKFIPVYSAPWNTIHEELEGELIRRGYIGVSTYNITDGHSPLSPDVDIINWNEGAHFYTEEYVLKRLLEKLEETTHIGFMGHHRTIGEEGFAFTEKLLDFLNTHGNVSWIVPLSYDYGKKLNS